MPEPLTTGEKAMADQLLAFAADDLAKLIRAVRAGDACNGEAQNTANFIALLQKRHNSAYLAALLITAIRQIPPAQHAAG